MNINPSIRPWVIPIMIGTALIFGLAMEFHARQEAARAKAAESISVTPLKKGNK